MERLRPVSPAYRLRTDPTSGGFRTSKQSDPANIPSEGNDYSYKRLRTLLLKHLVDERDRDRALTDCRRDTLDVAAAHVAHGKDTGAAGLEKVRPAAQGPS